MENIYDFDNISNVLLFYKKKKDNKIEWQRGSVWHVPQTVSLSLLHNFVNFDFYYNQVIFEVFDYDKYSKQVYLNLKFYIYKNHTLMKSIIVQNKYYLKRFVFKYLLTPFPALILIILSTTSFRRYLPSPPTTSVEPTMLSLFASKILWIKFSV